jgi:hypothetical protein
VAVFSLCSRNTQNKARQHWLNRHFLTRNSARMFRPGNCELRPGFIGLFRVFRVCGHIPGPRVGKVRPVPPLRRFGGVETSLPSPEAPRPRTEAAQAMSEDLVRWAESPDIHHGRTRPWGSRSGRIPRYCRRGNLTGHGQDGSGLFWFRGDGKGGWSLVQDCGLPTQGLSLPHGISPSRSLLCTEEQREASNVRAKDANDELDVARTD